MKRKMRKEIYYLDGEERTRKRLRRLSGAEEAGTAWTATSLCFLMLSWYFRSYLLLCEGFMMMYTENLFQIHFFIPSSVPLCICLCCPSDLLSVILSSSSWTLLPMMLWDACLIAQWCVHWGPDGFALEGCFEYFLFFSRVAFASVPELLLLVLNVFE